jgi:N-acetylglucosamine-6-phosphate deacetylase
VTGTGWLIENVRLVTGTEGETERPGWLWHKDGTIAAIGGPEEPVPAEAAHATRIDGKGGWLLPGFIDVHVHGGAGHDFMETDAEKWETIARFHAGYGTTGLLATTVTATKAELDAVLETAGRCLEAGFSRPAARLLGVHFEGPFINVKRKGAQNPAAIVPPQPAWLEDWTSRFPGIIRMLTLAPETEGALDFIEMLVKRGIVASCGHTDANWSVIKQAADRGLRQAVHTYNAMSPLHHREPGTLGAVLTDDRIMAEVIADGEHVHPAAIELLVRAKGISRVTLITDAIAAAGMPDGEYELGGLPVIMRGGTARLKGGDTLAGSTLTMIDAFRFMVRKVGVSVADASRMASQNPARQFGIDGETGSLKAGLRADVLLLDEALRLERVWVGGEEVEPAGTPPR